MTDTTTTPLRSTPIATRPGFLWGAATAAHQVEGGNTDSDWWELEHSGSPVVVEPSGRAADHFTRWPEDLDLLAALGLNSYRFSIEWARIEPRPGRFSAAALDHYRAVIQGCLARGLTPVVTLQHVTLPRWFRAAGGWAAPDAAERFAAYAAALLPVLDGVEWVCTINEPNLQPLMTALHRGDPAALNAWHGGPMPVATPEDIADLVRAHRAASAVIRDGSGARTGWSVASTALQATPDGDAHAREWFAAHEAPFLDAAAEDDWVGVQNYTRIRFDGDGEVPRGPGDRMTSIWEYYPEALGDAVRTAARHVGGTPIIVTENGVPTDDDPERIEFISRALTSLEGAIADGVDVRGYLHWSAIDNFEWALGYAPRFGLIGFDPVSLDRHVKPSAHWYGGLAYRSALASSTRAGEGDEALQDRAVRGSTTAAP